MSSESAAGRVGESAGLDRGVVADATVYRVAALASVAVVAGTYLSVLYHVVDVVGGVTTFAGLIVASVVLATFLGRAFDSRGAILVGTALLGLGLSVYLLSVPAAYWEVVTVPRILADVVALLTGFSIVQMIRAGVWALAVTPAPTFLTAYFAARGEFVRATSVATTTLGFFVLTGDAPTTVVLLGVLGAASAVGFTALARYGASRDQVEVIAATLAVMVVASATVTVVPGTGASPLLPTTGGSVQADVVSASDQAAIGGSIHLSPKVQFTVTADRAAYWRTNAYSRYTGSGWVRTGDLRSFDGEAPRPVGQRWRLEQTVTIKSRADVLPAAARPSTYSGDTGAEMSPQGTLFPTTTLSENETYTVVSLRPETDPVVLQNAGTDYPEAVTRQYLQMPGSTPGRVAEFTSNLTENATTPYETALLVERWLEANKGYSTQVSRPRGDIAAKFLFDMDEAYCVYFATTMVAMLRTQGVPARYATGYTPGQQADEDTWVVRGYDSHAWVEVYFPDVGWVQFDPTPSGPRQDVEQARLSQAREDGVTGIEAAGSEDGAWTPTPEETTADDPDGSTPTDENETTSTADGRRRDIGGGGSGLPDLPGDTSRSTTPGATDPVRDGDQSGGLLGGLDWEFRWPSREVLVAWGVVLAGGAVALRRLGAFEWAYRWIWLRVPPRGDDPADAVDAAFARVEYLLGREHRPRQAGETVREYLAAVDADGRAREIAEIRERAEYAGDVGGDAADRARRLARDFVAERVGTATVFSRLIS